MRVAAHSTPAPPGSTPVTLSSGYCEVDAANQDRVLMLGMTRASSLRAPRINIISNIREFRLEAMAIWLS
jgi:hypothetical protein